MSATERLRAILDERGVEYEGGERSLRWRDRNGIMMQAFPLANGELGMDVWSCTPEQAIAATLGDADIKAENAKLRHDLEEANNQAEEVCIDNAKLRELVRDVYSLHWHGADCTECPWFDECDNHGGGCPWLGILANRMRELGVEVSE